LGHQRLKKPPQSQPWHHVSVLLGEGRGAEEIAEAAARAIEKPLAEAEGDPALAEAVLLLASLPGAAKLDDFQAALRDLGVAARRDPSLLDLLAALDRAIDREARSHGARTDLGELAQLAAAESLTTWLSPGVEVASPAEIKNTLATYDNPQTFARLSRTFFADLIRRSLDYYLDRFYAEHVGPSKTFSSIRSLERFRSALAAYCHNRSLAIEQQSADWFAKAKHEGGVTRSGASNLAKTALAKLLNELGSRSQSDA
jgi:hypothetical protein